MIIEDLQVIHVQACPPFVEVNFDRIVSHPDHPENVVRIDVHVVVVDLLGEIGLSDRTGINVQSNKGERTLMFVTVRSDEPALTEAHVRLKSQSCPATAGSVDSGAAAPNMG
jgi:hypothetical protein